MTHRPIAESQTVLNTSLDSWPVNLAELTKAYVLSATYARR